MVAAVESVEIASRFGSEDCGGGFPCEGSGTDAGPLVELDASTEAEESGAALGAEVAGSTGGLASEGG